MSELDLELAQEFNLAESWHRFASSVAAKDLERIFTDLVDGAIVAIKECSDYRESEPLVIRYQQRSAVVEYLRSYIASQAAKREELREQWKEDEHGNTSS